MKKILAHYIRKNNGTAAVEFALVVMGFLTVVFGMIDTSRAFMALNVLQNGLESATRYAIVNPDSTEQEIQDFITEKMSGFTLSADSIAIAVTYPSVSDTDFIEISATYQFTPLLIGFLPDTWSTLTLPASARTPIPTEP